MAFILKDRVRETSTTTGTGAFTLAGAISGYRSFGSIAAVGDTFWYTIVLSATSWETGVGTYSATNTLTRTTVLESSNSDALVNFGVGTKDVFIDFPSSKMSLLFDNNGLTQGGFKTGDLKTSLRVSADPGWIIANDGTIGDASSGATARANADTYYLFEFLYNTFSNATCPVSGGRTGDAETDFNAHKTISTGTIADRALVSSGVTRGTMSAFGSDTTPIAQVNLPSVNFAVSVNGTASGSVTVTDTRTWQTEFFKQVSTTPGGAGSFGFFNNDSASNTSTPLTLSGGSISGSFTGASVTATGTAASGGSGTAISVTQKSVAISVHIKL